MEGEEGLSKNTLCHQHQKADRIHVTSEKVHDGKVLRRLVRGDEEREGEKGACGWCV